MGCWGLNNVYILKKTLLEEDNKNKINKISPGRKQYFTLKKNNPNSLLLVRMGDFYEAFEDDAKKL